MNGESLLNTENTDQISTEDESVVPKHNPNKLPKKMMLVLAAVVVVSTTVAVIAIFTNSYAETTIRIALPDQSPFRVLLGESRVLEVLFFSGHDNRIGGDYLAVTLREVEWSTDSKDVATIDAYGRLTTLKAGTVTVRAQLKSNTKSHDEKKIQVVENAPTLQPLPKRVIDYSLEPANLNPVRQKLISFFTKQEALASDEVPQSIKVVIRDPGTDAKKTKVVQEEAVWDIVEYADKSGKTYVTRRNNKELFDRDRTMHMMGNRYLPGDGFSVLSIEDDTQGGLWTANEHGASHIALKAMSYRAKAEIMTQNTRKYVMRHGLASDSTFSNGKWVPVIADNDGLWTSMFAAGEFMRYKSLKDNNFPQEDITAARASALRSLKAVLLVANIPMRDATIDAKIRHYINTRAGSGEKLSAKFLKKGRPFAVDTYSGSSADGEGFFGIDSGKTIDNAYYGGKFTYSFEPLNADDWSDVKTEAAATSKRSLKGFWARTFVIESKDGTPGGSGLYFRHNEDKSQYVISGADKLYDYTKEEHPKMNLGNLELPELLKTFLEQEVGQYNRADLIYKGDTSTDEVIGHLFIYKIAYDILDQKDEEEKSLKDLIRTTLVNFCTCLTNNDYTMVDATGQGTSWAKLTHTFITSDFTLEDAPIKAIQLLLSFKLCHYVTGDTRWTTEYQFLIKDPSFRYLDVVAAVWKRWTYRAYNQDAYADYGVFRLDSNIAYSETEITRHVIASLHFSDEQQAFLAFYLAFQLEDNKEYLKKYRQGLEGWWKSISRSENPLWYYIYQLAYPDEKKQDHYGQVLTEIASWHLSRHPVDTKKTAAFVQGSRQDVMVEGKERVSTLSMDPHKPIGKRMHKPDGKYFDRPITHLAIDGYDPMTIYEFKVLPADERNIHKFNGASFEGIQGSNPLEMEAATIYTLPYWMGVYHKMLKLE